MKYGKRWLVPALVAGGFLLFAPALHTEEAAFFKGVSGIVETKASGSDVWVKAAAGDRIEKDTVISTGFKSTAAVVVGDSVITVRPVTRLSLKEIVRNQKGEQVSVHLQTGRIRADVKPPIGRKTDFVITSPTATASVRGTSFEFDTETLRVDEGRVEYASASGRGGRVGVAAGGMSYTDEINHTVVSPFETAVELLTPALPPGGDSGGPLGDKAPSMVPPTDVGVISFDWE